MTVSVNADLSGIGSYIGAVKGTLQALESPNFKGNFITQLTNEVKRKFMVDAQAVQQAGSSRISHMFDWDENGTGAKPLFALTKRGGYERATISFKFLPSTNPVPLPDPAKYGFDEGHLEHLKEHVFVQKALVMETMESVVIAPKGGKKLFIPDATNDRGFYMTPHSKTINPGGPGATGGFAEYWNAWFSTEGQKITDDFVKEAETIVKKVGETVIRHRAGTVINGTKVGGRYAAAVGVSIAYVDAEAQSAMADAASELKSYYNGVSELANE